MIKHTPTNVCDFCGYEAQLLVQGIGHGSFICRGCAATAVKITGEALESATKGTVKHPASTAFERAEQNRNMMQVALQGSQANAYSLNDPSQLHGGSVFDPFEGS